MIDLDHTQWRRQRLDRDRAGSPGRCVDDVAGLYGTAPTCYLSCAARIDGFAASDLDRALFEERSLVRRRALRGSQFMMPVDLLDVAACAPDRRRASAEKWVLSMIDAPRLSDLVDGVVSALSGVNLTVRQLRQELDLDGVDAAALKYVIAVMEERRLICVTTVTGGWRSNQYRYGLWDDWLPKHPPRNVDGAAARATLAGWYLRGHGPATADDFRWWSGFTKRGAVAALDDAGAVVVATPRGSLFDLPDAPGTSAPPAGLRLLPVWDTAVVTQKERRRMVPEVEYRRTYDPSGNATSMIAHEGKVVGIWDRQGDDDRFVVKAAPFTEFDEATWELIEAEAAMIAAAVGAGTVDVARRRAPIDLHERYPAERNRFLSPLG